jgi:RNA polymerase sigma-70 factor, ECF subfamily
MAPPQSPRSAAPPLEPLSDAEILRRLRDGDRDAFEALFRAYYAALSGFVHRLVRSRAIAEELVQDVMLKIWLRRDRLAEVDSLRTYLFRAARNHALNHLRRRRLEILWSTAPRDEREQVDRGVDEVAARDELADAAAAAIDRLAPRCRQVFLMSRADGLTYPEIARVLGISVKTVETQMGRALKSLRNALAGQID